MFILLVRGLCQHTCSKRLIDILPCLKTMGFLCASAECHIRYGLTSTPQFGYAHPKYIFSRIKVAVVYLATFGTYPFIEPLSSRDLNRGLSRSCYRKVVTVEYVVQDCPICGKVIVKHYVGEGKNTDYGRIRKNLKYEK